MCNAFPSLALTSTPLASTMARMCTWPCSEASNMALSFDSGVAKIASLCLSASSLAPLRTNLTSGLQARSRAVWPLPSLKLTSALCWRSSSTMPLWLCFEASHKALPFDPCATPCLSKIITTFSSPVREASHKALSFDSGVASIAASFSFDSGVASIAASFSCSFWCAFSTTYASIAVFTPAVATSYAVLPAVSRASTSALPSSSTCTAALWPLLAALCNGVHPFVSRASTSALPSSSTCTAALWPLLAALCNGVHPFVSRASTSALPSSSTCTAALWPLLAAQCNGVHSCISQQSTCVPMLKRRCTSPTSPALAAARSNFSCPRPRKLEPQPMANTQEAQAGRR